MYLGAAGSQAAAAPRHPSPATLVAQVLSEPDGEIDFARAKLTFDQIIDPSINAAWISTDLKRLEHAADNMAGPSADSPAKLRALRKVIYESGPWNGNRSFGYDHADPFGKDIRNKLLSTYLATRRGNCVSMPALYLILADRMGLNVALATAPLHEFVRYTDAAGHRMNLETTSGAFPARDSWIRQQMPMSERAVESGLYMRTLTRRESVALMAETVVEFLLGAGRNQEATEVASVILEYDPRNGNVMVLQASGYARIISSEFQSKYPSTNLIPLELLPRYLDLNARNHAAYDAATALGWQPVEE